MEVNKIYHDDCLNGLKKLPDNYVDCCVTSPPYYGLRDYGTAKWDGGDPNCDHAEAKIKTRYDYKLENSMIQDGTRTGTDGGKWKRECPTCQAINVDDQIGLEETPEEYVIKMVEVFEQVRRVLKKEGTLWLNLGDSYASAAKTNGRNDTAKMYGEASQHLAINNKRKINHGVKEKDLIGIPWMVAFALRSAGWYLRQDIIWAKPNPMPESVTDRCTKSHEYIFLLSKSARYYYDAEAIKQEAATLPHAPGWATSMNDRNGKANKRSVWTINTLPYSEAHFATFPETLIIDCIKAGCAKDGIVLDPFMGAGTTALVARSLDRNYIGFELNQEYIKIAHKRMKKHFGMFYDP